MDEKTVVGEAESKELQDEEVSEVSGGAFFVKDEPKIELELSTEEPETPPTAKVMFI